MIRREQAVDTLWVITGDDELRHCADTKIRDDICKVEFIDPGSLTDRSYWRSCEIVPGAILLDLGSDMDWGVEVLRGIKRAQIRAPIIVVSDDFTKEFGTKIVSEGVSYCLLRGSDCSELCEVVNCLIHSRKAHGSEHPESHTG